MARKQHKFHYIYKTTCTVTGRYYVGMHSTSNLEDDYIGSGKRLWLSIRKHGRENHQKEILEFLPDRRSLKERERELVNESLIQDPMCMNLATGGDGGFRGKEAARAGCVGMLKKVWKDPEYIERKRKKGSEIFKKLHSEGKLPPPPEWTGRKHRPETIEKLKNQSRQKGSKNSQYGTCWINKNLENKKIKKEQLQDFILNGWNLGRKIIRAVSEETTLTEKFAE
jgi:hypothetical protein